MKSTRTYALLYLALFAAAALLAGGCARFTSTQTDASDEKTKVRTITTRITGTTFFASKSDLAKLKASQTDKTQTLGIGALSQSADASTNLTAIVEAVVGAAVKAAKP